MMKLTRFMVGCVVAGCLGSLAETPVAYAVYTGAANGDTGAASNWACYNLAMEDVPNAVPSAEGSHLFITGSTAFQCPPGSTVRWSRVVFSPTGGPKAFYGNYFRNREFARYAADNKNDALIGMNDDTWKNLPVCDYTSLGEYAFNNWAAGVNNAQVRIEGRFFVSAEQVGTWAIRQRFDDFFVCYFDGAQAVLNNTYTVDGKGSWTATAGWHDFVIICGDTFGGEGATLSYNGMSTPMLITINGAGAVPFEMGDVQLGNQNNNVYLAANCDWRGLGVLQLPAGLRLDLQGHVLRIAGAKGTLANGVTICDSVGGGQLIVDGSTGGTLDAKTVVFEGNVVFSVVNAMPATATWTGAGDRSNVSDPANWTCKDVGGHVIQGGVPGSDTVISVGGTGAFNLPLGSTLTCKELRFTDVRLAGACDWRGTLASAPQPTGLVGRPLTFLDAPAGSYVNTDYKPDQDTRTVMDVDVASAREYWFGCSQNPTSTTKWHYKTVYMFGNDSGNVYCAYENQTAPFTPIVPAGRHVVEKNGALNYIDGVLRCQYVRYNFRVDRPLYLFAQNRGGVAAPGDGQGTIRCYSTQMYQGANCVRDFIPVKTADGVALWDRANQVLYPNVGTGAFGGGVEIPTGTQSSLAVPAGFTTDLNGYSLKLAAGDAAGTNPTIVNRSAAVAALTLDMTPTATMATSFFTLEGGISVTINLNGARPATGTMLLGLTRAVPSGVTFTLDAATAALGERLFVTSGAVYYGADPNAVAQATWTGRGETGDVTDPANWSCVNLNGNPVVNGVPDESTDVFFNGRCGLVAAGPITWQSVTMAADARVTVDYTDEFKADWDGSGALFTLATGLHLPTGATNANIVDYLRFTNMRYTPVLSGNLLQVTATPTSTLLFHHRSYGGTRSGMANDLWVDMPLADYVTEVHAERSFAGVAGNGTAWQTQYVRCSQCRFDGWFYVRPEQAGEWKITQGYDDYMALAIDNTWVVVNSTFQKAVTATVTVSAGWHAFALIAGDTYGGYGANNFSPNGYPLCVEINGKASIKFSEENFLFEDPTALTAGDFTVTVPGEVNGLTFEVASACRLVLNPLTTTIKLHTAPSFSAGAKIALAPELAGASEGRYRLMTWEEGEVGVPANADLTSLFDATSVASSDFVLTTRTVGTSGGELLLTFHPETFVEKATWTGLAGTRDITTPGNWLCENVLGATVPNGLPHAGSRVKVANGATLTIPPDANPAWEYFELSPSFALTDDLDWRGLANVKVVVNTLIDLRGHTLSLGGLVAENKITITDTSVGTPGTLDLDIPADVTFTNTKAFALKENARLVKNGEGTYCPALGEQTYTGGTVIRAGVLNTPVSGSSSATYSPWQMSLLGPHGASIRVEGGVLDIKGNYDYRGFPLTFAGGALANTGCDMTKTTWGGLDIYRLESDTTFTMAYSTLFNANPDTPNFDLQGHTFTVNLETGKYLYMGGVTIANGGAVKMNGDGQLWLVGEVTAPTVDFDLNCRLEIKNPLTVHDLTLRHDAAWGWSTPSALTKVRGRFTPLTGYIPSIELQNNSTLDLKAWTTPFSTKSLEVWTSDNKTPFYMTFAEGAEVTLDVSGRVFSQHETQPVVTWEAKPENGATIVLDRVSAKANRLWVDDTGIWVQRREGTVIYLR